MLKKLLDKRFYPYYVLVAGIIVFFGAFLYASSKNKPAEEKKEENLGNELSTPGGEQVNSNEETNDETPTMAPSLTLVPTKAKLSPTQTPTNTQTPTPTTPTSAPSNTHTPTPTSSTPTETPMPTVTETPTPTP